MPDPVSAPVADAAQQVDDPYNEDFSAIMDAELLESEQVQAPKRDVVAAHYAAYRLSADLEELPFDEHVRLPLARTATDDAVARLAAPFILDRTPCLVTAVEGTDPEHAQANQALLNRQFRDKRLLNGPKNLIKAAKITRWAGSAYAFIDWIKERRWRFGIGNLRDENLDLDGPRWKIVHPYDVYPDPRADDIFDMRYIWIREEMSQREFIARVRAKMYPLATPEIVTGILASAGIQSGIVGGIGSADRFDLALVTGNIAPSQADSDMAPAGQRPITLFHRFTREKWCIAGVTQQLVREVPLPTPDGEIPIRMCSPNPDIQGPDGCPDAEASHGMNKNANRVASAYMEVVDRAGLPTILMREGDQDSVMPADVTGCPYEILTVPDPKSSMVPMEKGSESAQVNLQAVEFFKYQSEIGSKSGDYRTGVSAAGAPGTATGTQSFDSQADRQFAIPFSLFSDFVDELLALTVLYNQSFLEKSQVLKRIGRQGVYARTYRVDRPMLQGEFEITTTAAGGDGDPRVVQGIGSLVNQFGGIPGLLNMPYLAYEHAKAARVPNPQKAVPAYMPDPIPVEDAIELVKNGIDFPAHPADDHQEFADAFFAAAMEAQDQGDEETAALLAAAGQERLMILGAMLGASSRGQDVGNPDGGKASDKGRPVPGGPRGRVVPGPGASPGPTAPPGRDLRPAGAM